MKPMTKPITVHAAKTGLSRLIERACAGEEIIIARRNVPVVRLVPVNCEPQKRKFGSMKGRAKVTKAFFDPLPTNELEIWAVNGAGSSRYSRLSMVARWG
jgi:prevent-host-death family protein